MLGSSTALAQPADLWYTAVGNSDCTITFQFSNPTNAYWAARAHVGVGVTGPLASGYANGTPSGPAPYFGTTGVRFQQGLTPQLSTVTIPLLASFHTVDSYSLVVSIDGGPTTQWRTDMGTFAVDVSGCLPVVATTTTTTTTSTTTTTTEPATTTSTTTTTTEPASTTSTTDPATTTTKPPQASSTTATAATTTTEVSSDPPGATTTVEPTSTAVASTTSTIVGSGTPTNSLPAPSSTGPVGQGSLPVTGGSTNASLTVAVLLLLVGSALVALRRSAAR